ncbi:MAG TPA: sugar-binding protein [Capsulimonadaceae bacterium]|nr:sugar-binding protein [Capsulimonadaceae bacterium]
MNLTLKKARVQKALAAALLVSTVGLMAGCSNSGGGSSSSGSATTGGTTTGGAPTAGKQIALAFVTNNTSDYWTIARKGTDDAQKELPNVTVQFVIPSDGTAATQKSQVDDLLAKGIQGFAISPVDPKDQTQMLDDAEKKTHVFTQDSDAADSTRECYVGTDNVAAGRQEGQEIMKALPNGGKIMLFVGKIDAQNAHDRYQGIQEALKGSKIQILDVRTDDTDRAKAIANVADTLVKYPDIAGLVGLWSYNGPAIATAVKNAGKVGKVKIICFDQEAGTLQGIKDGTITATVVQDPYQIGYQSIKMLAADVNGDKSAIPASKQKFIPTQVVDKTNVDDYQTKLNKMLGKS